MTTAYTSLLGLALPVTGELSGTWGTTVNDAITSLLDSAIAGTTTISSDADVTLTTTTGAANTSREAILLWTAGGTVTRNITAPAQSKTYIVINKSSSTQSIVLRGVGPTTGVTIIKGESAVCAWNGSDFVKVSNISGAGTFSSITNTGLTSGRVVYSTTGGLETDSANLTFDGTTLTAAGFAGPLNGTVGATTANTGSFTSLAYSTTLTGGTGIVNLGSGQFYKDASGNVGIGNTSPAAKLHVGTLNGSGSLNGYTKMVVEATDYSVVTLKCPAANTNQIIFTDTTTTSLGGINYYNSTNATPNAMAFLTAGAERMRIDSSGNVGIGTNSPSQKLQVNGNARLGTGAYLGFPDSGGAFTRFTNGEFIATSGQQLQLCADNSDGTIAFFTTSTGSASNERMRIDSSGNVGIGTSSTVYNLQVNSAASTVVAVSSSNTASYPAFRLSNTGTSGRAFQLGLGGSTSAYSGQFYIYDETAAAVRMLFDTSGNVGIGTTTPTTGYKLNVGSTSAVTTLNGAAITLFTSGGLTSSVGGVLNFRPQLGTTTSDIFNLSICAYDHSGDGNADGLSINGSDGVSFSTGGNSRSERMRIDYSGNVGIGKTSTDKPLEIYAATNPAIRIQNSTTGTGTNDGLLIEVGGSDALLNNYEAGNLKFGTSNSERMRIDSSGYVFLNCTSSPTSNSTAIINAIASGGDGINLKQTADGNNMFNLWQTGTANYVAISFNKGSSQTGVGSINCTTSATSYNTSSDYRLKESIAPMAGALAKIAALKPVTYKWKLDGSDAEGFIAHELAEVCPHAVTGEKDAVYKDGNPKYQGVDTSFLVATLTAAIQEQQALITSLTARIVALESN
jgi:hypothetical protein